MQVVEFVPVLDTSIYADNDVLFVPIAVPPTIGATITRKLVSVVILDGDDQGQDIDLVFSQGSITLGTINSAVSVSDADAADILGIVSIVTTDYSDLINSQLATKRGIDLIIRPNDTLYVSGICRSGTPTYTAAGMRIRLGFEYQG